MNAPTDHPSGSANGVPGDYLDLRLAEFLDEVAGGGPAPGAGSVAPVMVALAAGLVARAGGQGGQSRKGRAKDAVTRAEEIRGLVAPLAHADADAYMRVTALAQDPSREDALHEALSDACEVPLAVARYAAEVAGLAAHLARRGDLGLRGEVMTAAALAEAAARVAAMLVRLSLSDREDPRIAQAARLAGQARRDASRVTYTS